MMGRIAKRLILLFCTMVALSVLTAPAYANEYARRVQNFLNDPRWCDGVSWGGGQQPKTPGLSDFYGCAAYACDFARFVWGVPSSYHDGTAFYSYLDISDGDVIHTGSHYYVVLHREGNELWTAEGNYDSRVWVTTSHYSMSNTHFSMGWHNPVIQPYDPTVYLNVDGLLDGQYFGTVEGFGTFDVYINGVLAANDVVDFYKPGLPFGTGYKITDIRAANGYVYTGSEINGNVGIMDTDVQLTFETKKMVFTVNPTLDGHNVDSSETVCSFDLYINGTLQYSGRNSLIVLTLQKGTEYEVRNIRPIKPGIRYDGASGGLLKGKVEEWTSVRLSFSTISEQMLLPANLETVWDEAFAGTGAIEIVVPDGCTTIKNRAFADSPSLKHIMIPASVKNIAADAFENCPKLTIHAPADSVAIDLAVAQGIPYVRTSEPIKEEPLPPIFPRW
ncbi:MAG: leucine-rich repeat domain-containing protein [Oscillospiraceae bacterium]|nr:leucine-rich repeat domain-containing protein [Oscillospiraceae bacterium]